MDTDFKCLAIVLRVLKFLGLCLLERQRKQTKVHYEFVWSSKSTIVSLLVASCMVFVYFIALTHVVFQQLFVFGPGIRHTVARAEVQIRNASQMSQFQISAHLSVLTAIQTMTIAQYFFYLLASWSNRHILPSFLNNAISLAELELQREIKTKSSHRAFSFGAALYCFTMALAPGYFIVSDMTAHEDFILEFTFFGFIYFYTGMMEVGHDAAVVFSLRHLRHNFSQMRRCIQIGREPYGPTIDKWENAIYSIRQQGRLLSTYLAPGQLSSLVQTIGICTLTTFSALMNARVYESTTVGQPSEFVNYIVSNALCTLYMLGRLYYKASLAQQITNEENQLAMELGRLTIKEHEAALKVKRLVDMMTFKQCEINLSDLVILRKRLFLGVASQISTYLVVITQFYQP